MHGTQTMDLVAAACRYLPLVLLAVGFTGTAAGSSKSFNISNTCSFTVWPAISSGASSAAPATTGFELAPGQWEIVAVPSAGWSGSVWGRTVCSTEHSSGRFSCVTGDCGSGRLDCAGGNAVPPATLAEFTLDDGSAGMDSYYVSLVDGFNLPFLVAPAGGGGNCAPTGCLVDLNAACPAELRVMSSVATTDAVACKSACQAFGSPQFCCTGEYGNPGTCKPSAYSEFFKRACPRAYSYAYDGAASTFSCAAGGDSYYSINFCPSTKGGKHSNDPRSEAPETTGNLLLTNGGCTTPYTGCGGAVGGAASGVLPWRIVIASAILGLVAAVLSVVANSLAVMKAFCSR